MKTKTKIFLAVFASFALLSIIIGISMAGVESSNFQFPSSFSKQVGLVKIEGIINESNHIVKKINGFRDDDNIAAVLLRIDSPGGAVAPSQEIYQAVKNCAVKKPTIVSMGAVAASGGYYIASGATRIFANGGTLTGSIGVIMEFPRYNKLLEKIGVSIEILAAGKLKDAGSPFRELNQNEREYFDNLLKDTHKQFIDDVCDGRSMEFENVKLLAEGQIFTGNQAHSNGLIDTLGTFDDAKNYILETCELPETTVFLEKSKKEKYDFMEEFFLKTPIKNLFSGFHKSGIYYICESLL
ncbi:MAG: signal peptide peptidase SppA [Chitinispirillales bacterium]|jgi:protease-4|nr:signal peptide peptidase SppA [Chitinispirillales bacterium]